MIGRLWHKHRLLLISFVLVTLVTLALAVRIGVGLVYWASHANAPLEKWMPIGYVARSYDVDRQVLIDGLDLPRDSGSVRLSLTEISRQTGIPYPELEAKIYRLLREAGSPE